MSNWKKITLITVIIVVILAVSGWLYFKYGRKQGPVSAPNQQKIQDELNALDALRQQYNIKPVSQSQIQQQLQNLNQLRQATSTQTKTAAPTKLTPQQIQQQLDELQKLKQ